MRSFFPVTMCCISLFSLHQQLLALPTGGRLERNRLALLKRIEELSGGENAPARSGAPASPHLALEVRREWWKRRLSKAPPTRQEGPVSMPTDPFQALSGQRASRGRRHAHHGARGHHHPQLMRVGCVLGTCQVQNLSHRLYQLIGQSGREDSSPINPHSPHSYG
ncbi:protein ADM2 isoform X1 [Anguilla rostrata]|uniref:protein ADM2 isoform X1 n=1 Tax=Anguilla rostrata TaxID=7938 RepID=UPI0030CC0C26